MKLSKHFKIGIVILILALIYFISMSFLKSTPKGTTQFNILFWIQLIAFELMCLLMIYDLKFTNKKAKLFRVITLILMGFLYMILIFQSMHNNSIKRQRFLLPSPFSIEDTYESNLSKKEL